MSGSDAMDGESTGLSRESDGWKYTGPKARVHETRHEAVGEVAATARMHIERYGDHRSLRTPLEATKKVYAFKPYLCDYCSETFLTMEEHKAHRPCPLWQQDRSLPEGATRQ